MIDSNRWGGHEWPSVIDVSIRIDIEGEGESESEYGWIDRWKMVVD